MGRNQLYGPGFGDVDFSVLKTFRATERLTVQFRTELFNVFNRLNLASPVTGYAGPDGPGFGRSTTTIGDAFGAPGIGPGKPYECSICTEAHLLRR